MTKIGEQVRGDYFGYKGYGKYHKFEWTACPDCGIERWVQLIKSGLVSKRCRACHNRLKKKEDGYNAQREWYRRHPYKTRSIKRKLSGGISRDIRKSIYGNKGGRHWEDLVGYTYKQLRKHLENQFTEGMNWNNYGAWHIDHIIPISAFHFTTIDDIDFKRCWALSNLRPLWADENIAKGKKLIKPFQPSLK
jgi:hypothetical protein